MKEIKISVVDKVASAVGSPVIVCGNSNYKITFTFDNEWGAYQEKTARFTFIRDGILKYIDVLFSGNSCTVPILSNIERVSIGVYAGDLRTTTGAEIRCRKSILCLGGLKHELPPEDVYNQILETVSKKLGSEGGTVTGDYFKDGNTFIHEGNLELIEPKINEEINEVLANEKVVETASGSAITIESAKAPLQNLKLYGNTEQNGTPTPSAPVPFVSVGDSGSFEVKIQSENVEEQTLTMPYTLRSVGDIKDEVDFTKGSVTENTYKKVFTGEENTNDIILHNTSNGYYFLLYDSNIKYVTETELSGAKCNKLSEKIATELYSNTEQGFSLAGQGAQVRLRIDGITTVAQLRAKLKEWYDEGNPLTIITERVTPIETPLTETELNAYRQLMTHSGTTTILSEADMTLDYYINKPNAQAIGNIHSQVNKDYLKLQQAIISTGGN